MKINQGVLEEVYPNDLEQYYTSDGNIFSILHIPEGVIEIDPGVCKELEVNEIILPKSLEFIGNKAFKDCSSLTRIIIPKKVEHIGNNAFEGCSRLKYVELPSKLDTIYEETFADCTSLQEIKFPKKLERIKKNAFSNCKKLESIDLPSGILSIGTNSFAECSNLKSINIPSSMIYMGEGAFNSCKSLQSLNLPDNIEEIPSHLCENCSSLTEVHLPKNATMIGQRAFSSCSKLKNISIPENVTNIKHFAFSGCKELESVSLPNNPDLAIGGSVFSDCENLKYINLPEGIPFINVEMFKNCKSLTHIEIPSSVTSIISNGFNGSGIKYIKLPENLKSIGENAFASCKELEEIIIPENVKTIEKNTFNDCKKLRKIELPKNLTEIKDNAFSNCNSLININIPEGTKTLGHSAFSNCFALKYVDIPDSVEKIGDSCFFCDDKIEKVKLPKNLTEISDQAFANCYNLKSIEIPDTVKRLGTYAFYCCAHLEDIKLPNGIERINDYAFQHCVNLKSIEIPDSVKFIEESAFTGCKKLTDIKFSKNLQEIKVSAFANCTSLKSITLPDSLITIGTDAFYNCEKLVEVNFNEGLKYINASAFQFCPSLKKVKLPKSIKKVKDAFSGCSSLEEIFVPDSIELFDNSINKNLLYFRKVDDGFSLLSKETKDSIPLETLNINPAFLSKNWNYKDILIREQKNESISKFYNSFLRELPQKDIEKFLTSHNFTFFKQFNLDPENPPAENTAFYKFLYNMGGLEKPIIDKNGKTVDYAQKLCGFLLQKFNQGHLNITDIYYMTEKMQNNGFKKDFSDFFMKNYDELMLEDISNPGFFARCYNEFERVQKTNTNNHGSQRQLKPTIQKFKDYFAENKFLGITDENKHISDTISPYFSDQMTFDYAVKIDDERREKNSPSSILGFHLKEKNNPFENIDEYSEEIENLRVETLENLVDTATEQFNFEWLEKNDPKNYILGKLCSCCAHLEGVGEGIMHASITHPNVQNLVVKYGNEIIAKSTLYINPDEGYGVFNNVEINDSVNPVYFEEIYEKYILVINRFAEEYNKQHPNKPLKKISVGMNLNDLTDEIIKYHEPTEPLLEAIDYGKFTQSGEGYQGDSDEEQYTLWEKE